jgi:hypothetical protein
MEENPVPTDARQRSLGPSPGHAALGVSAEMPLRFGPRHWGQSAASEFEAKAAAVVIQHNFMGLYYHEARKLHGWIFRA